MRKRTAIMMPVAFGLCLASCGKNYENQESGIRLTNARLDNNVLELEGETSSGARTIVFDGCNGVPLAECRCPSTLVCFGNARSSEDGSFSVRLANFAAPNCHLSITDGSESDVAELANCQVLPNAPPPPQAPPVQAPPPPNVPGPGTQPPGAQPPNTPVQPPTNIANALQLVQQADRQIETFSAQVTGYADQMELAAANFENDIATAESNGDLAALEAAVTDALRALEYADAAALAGDQIARNLDLISTAMIDAAGFLTTVGASGRASAESMMALASAAEGRADEADAALGEAMEGLEALAEGLEDAAGVAEDLGQDIRAAQLEAEGMQAEAVGIMLEGSTSSIEAFEAAIDEGATVALEAALEAI